MIFMRRVDEFIQNKVGKKSQLHAYEIAEELWNFLKALDKKGQLRLRLRGTREEGTREDYVRIEQNADRIHVSFNKFYDMYLNEKKRDKFFKLTREFGFTDEDLTHLLHTQLMFIFLLNTEMFKNFLTFILKDVDPKKPLGKLFKELVKLTQETGEAENIAKRLDIDLRNSLAHFTFREDGSIICCYDHERKNEKYWILKERKIENIDLFNKMKEHNLLRTLLGMVIVDWYGL